MKNMSKSKYVLLIMVAILWIPLSFGIVSWMNQNNYQQWWEQGAVIVAFFLVYVGIAYATYEY